jgi:hypothetical protein
MIEPARHRRCHLLMAEAIVVLAGCSFVYRGLSG